MSCVRLFVCAFFREGGWRQAVVVAGAAGRYSALQDRGLCAGEMLRLAGYRPAQAWVRAGIGLRGAGGRTPPVSLVCGPVFCRALGGGRGGMVLGGGVGRTPPVSLRSTTSPERGGVAAGDGGVILLARRVLRSHFAYHTFLLKCLTFVPRLLFVARAKQGRLAGGCVPIPRGSRSPVERSQMLCGYRTCLVHFRLVRFFPAIPTGERSRRRGKVLFCENTLSLRCFPRGERWG